MTRELGGGRYRVGAKIGEGGMGAVYEAVRVHIVEIFDALRNDVALTSTRRSCFRRLVPGRGEWSRLIAPDDIIIIHRLGIRCI